MSAEEQDYSTLTQEEIDAINDDPSPEELITMRQAEEADDIDEDDDDDIEQEAQTENTETDPAVGDEPIESPAEEKPSAKQPAFESKLPDDFKDQVDALKAERQELLTAYKNGDIDFDQYEDQRESLSEREKLLDRAIIKAEISSEMSEQTAAQAWTDTVLSFTNDVAKAGGINYKTDAAKQADLDLFVKTLASRPENETKPMRWFLDQAHGMVKALHGVQDSVPSTKTTKQNRKPPIDDLPRTLAHVPGGSDTEEFSNKFASLDRLDGLDLEAALAKMSPSDREAYLRQ
jgi:hypothetical protein